MNVILLALFAVAAALSLVSAYGASCVAWDPTYWGRIVPIPPTSPLYAITPDPKTMTIMFQYMVAFGPFFQVMNVITWVTSFVTAFLIFGYLTGLFSKYIWYIALVNVALAFIAGLLPALIADTNGFTFTAFDRATQSWIPKAFAIGSPHWAKTIVNLLVLIVIAAMVTTDLLKKTSFKSFTAKDNRFTGNIGRQLMIVAFIFLWLSAFSFLATTFMADAHVVGGINVWEMIEIQSIGGFVNLIGGVSTLSAGLIYNHIKPPTFIKQK